MDKNSKVNQEIPARSEESPRNSRELLLQYQAQSEQTGSSQAAERLFDRYVTRLVSLARSRIGAGLKRRIDPEDVVQSAYRSFFVRAAGGDFELRESGDLWRLLAQITLNKLYSQSERHTAARRDFRREFNEGMRDSAQSIAPQPAEAAELIEQVRLVIDQLPGSQREVLSMHLQGSAVEEIATHLRKSSRTVRRLLAAARGKMENQLLNPEPDQPQFDVSPPDHLLSYSDFYLERLVGDGCMGKVYRARQEGTGHIFAVKALRKSRQTESRAVRQFLHEAEVIQRLDHPGIIRMHGLGRFPAGGYFIVMDYVEGGDLQQRIDQGSLSLEESLRIIQGIAEAIAHAHEAGVIHCDLKPANILLGALGRVVVTDFGFAQFIADEGTRSAIGGTLGYLAPEVALHGESPACSADIYSLGALLRKMVIESGNQLSRRQEQLEQSVLQLCDRCLAADPACRPHSTVELLSELRTIDR